MTDAIEVAKIHAAATVEVAKINAATALQLAAADDKRQRDLAPTR